MHIIITRHQMCLDIINLSVWYAKCICFTCKFSPVRKQTIKSCLDSNVQTESKQVSDISKLSAFSCLNSMVTLKPSGSELGLKRCWSKRKWTQLNLGYTQKRQPDNRNLYEHWSYYKGESHCRKIKHSKKDSEPHTLHGWS